MENNRMRNASRNMFFGILLKIYQIMMPFVIRTALIYLMGVEYLGLNSLFSSILQVLNLAELGVGTAMVFSMYKPIAEGDGKTICALLKLYKIYYRGIGLFISICGGALTPYIHYLIKNDIPPNLNIYVLYLLNLAATVLSYWLFAYKSSLLQAHQRIDIISKVSIVTSTVQYLLQIAVLWIFHNYYYFVIVSLFTQASTNIVNALLSSKIYPQYQPKGNLDRDETREINLRIRDLFTAKLGTIMSTSVDNIIISAFLGLSMLAIYQNYYYIMNAVVGIILVVFNSCTAGIGNSLVAESSEKNYNDFKKLALLTIWICIICISCFACVYQPFMSLWVDESLKLPDLIILLMCLYFYVYVIQMLSCVYKDAAGIWHQDRFRPLVAGVVNLILNISLVRVWGIYAIVLSTIISYIFVAMPWAIRNLFSIVFKRSSKEFIWELIKGAAMAAVSGGICYLFGNSLSINGGFGVVIRIIIAFVISNICVIVFKRRNETFSETIDLINTITKFKFDKILNILKMER